MLHRLKTFFDESRQELKKVNWPTRKETIRYTGFVIVLSLAFSIFLGMLDYLFSQVLQQVVL